MSQGIVFHYELNQGDFAILTAKLRELAGTKANTYIARALNKTAVSARKKLGTKAQESYTVKRGGFNKDMRIKNATAGHLVAEINSNGNTLEIKKFKYSAPKSGVKVDIVKSGLKPLGKYGNKAFVGRGSAHGQVYVRTSKSRLPIEKLKSKSVPYMLGSNRVWTPTSPEIESDLKKFMAQQIALLLG